MGCQGCSWAQINSMKYTRELWVFPDRDTLRQTLYWQLNLKSTYVVWCKYESWANIERDDVTILLRVIPNMDEAYKYAGKYFSSVVFMLHEEDFYKDVVQYLKCLVRQPKEN